MPREPFLARILSLLIAGAMAMLAHGVSFGVTQSAPAAPSLLAPADGARLAGFGTQLRWSNPPGATQYYLEVLPSPSTPGGPPDGPAITLVRNVSAGPGQDVDERFALEPPVMGQGNYVLLPDMTYTWRVRASDKESYAMPGDPSYGPEAQRTFRTPRATSDQISPVSPPDGGSIDSLTPVLQWSDGDPNVFYYELQLSADTSFNTDPATATAAVYWELVHGGQTNPPDSYQVPVAFPLLPGTDYYWRLRPRVQGDGEPAQWSRTFAFRTTAPQVHAVSAFPGLRLNDPTSMVQTPTRPDRFFITEQSGRIRLISGTPDGSQDKVFLDISNQVYRGDNEEGLLGLAFDPDYGSNGRFYVYYSANNPRRNILSRFNVRPGDPDSADPGSEVRLLESPKPFGNHNGGQLAFGPDGYLYVGIGDGGSGGDPYRNGQNTGVILAKILRIDVRGDGYRVPPDNPFAGQEGKRGEIWAYGLRNPWRFSFDRANGRLWVADVGQNQYEEVDIVQKGGNYGWNIMEGNHCFRPANNCDSSGLQPPVVEYDHSQGCSITGGYVYRGSRLPSLAGAYLYGDFCSGRIWAVWSRSDGQPINTLLQDSDIDLTTFGQDLNGELYLVGRSRGIYRLEAGR